MEYNGVEFEPYNDSVAPDPAVTLVGDYSESGQNAAGHEIEGMDADEVYQTMMWGEDEFAVEPGTYDVTLQVAEIFLNVDGGNADPAEDEERTFSAYVNGELVFEALKT